MISRVSSFPLKADLMVNLDNAWLGVPVQIPGRDNDQTATEFCASHGLEFQRPEGCVPLLAGAMEHMSMHLYLAEAVEKLQAHLKQKGHTYDGMEGHTATWLRKAATMRRLGSRPEVEIVLEIGFNAGHSALNWLTSNPRLRVVAFDMACNSYTLDAAAWMYEHFPGRFFLVAGPSALSVPSFADIVPELKANIIFVDGDHSLEGVRADFAAVAPFVNHTWHRVLVDDLASSDNGALVKRRPLPETHEWQRGLEAAWREQVETGVVEELYRVPDNHEGCRDSPLKRYFNESEVTVGGPSLSDAPHRRERLSLPSYQGFNHNEALANELGEPFDDSLWLICENEPPPLHPMLGDLAVGRFLAKGA